MMQESKETSLSKEELIQWIKKAKVKIKKLEAEKEVLQTENQKLQAVPGAASVANPDDELVKNVEETANYLVNSFWTAASAVTTVVKGTEGKEEESILPFPRAPTTTGTASISSESTSTMQELSDKCKALEEKNKDVEMWKQKCAKFSALAKSQKKEIEEKDEVIKGLKSHGGSSSEAPTGNSDVDVASLQEQVDELKWEADDRIKEVERLQNLLREKTELVLKATDTANKATEEASKATAEIQRLQSLMEKTSTVSSKDVEDAHRQHQIIVDELKTQVVDLQTKLAEVKADQAKSVDSEATEVAALKTKLAEQVSECATLRERMMDMTSQLDKSSSATNAAHDTLVAQHQNELAALSAKHQTEITAVHEKHEQQMALSEQSHGEAMKELSTLQSELTEVRKALALAETNVTEGKKRLNETLALVATANETSEQLRHEVKNSQQQEQSLREEMEMLREQLQRSDQRLNALTVSASSVVKSQSTESIALSEETSPTSGADASTAAAASGQGQSNSSKGGKKNNKKGKNNTAASAATAAAAVAVDAKDTTMEGSGSKDIKDKEAIHEEFTQKIVALTQLNDQYKKEVQDLTNGMTEKRALDKEKLANAQKEIDALKNKAKELTNELQATKTQLSTHADADAMLQKQLVDLQTINNQQRTENQKNVELLKKDLDVSQSETKTLKQQLADVQAQMNAKQSDSSAVLREKTEAINKATEDAAALKKQCDALLTAKNDNEKQVSEMEGKAKKQSAEMDILKKLVDDVRSQLKKSEQQCSEYEQQVTLLTKSMETMRSQLSESSENVGDKQMIFDLQAQLDMNERKTTEDELKLVAMTQEIVELKAKVATIAELEQQVADMEIQLTDSEVKRREDEEKFHNSVDELNALKGKLAETVGTDDVLQEQISTLQHQLSESEKKLTTATKQVKSLNAQLSASTDADESMQTQIRELQLHLNEKETIQRQLETKLETMGCESATLKGQIKDHAGIQKQLKEVLEQLEIEKKQRQDAEANIAAAESETTALQTQVKANNSALAIQVTELQAQLEEERKEVQRLSSTSQSESEQSGMETKTALATAEKKAALLMKKAKELQGQVEAYSLRVAELEEENALSREERERFRQRVLELEGALSDTEMNATEVQRLSKELDIARKAAEEVQIAFELQRGDVSSYPYTQSLHEHINVDDPEAINRNRSVDDVEEFTSQITELHAANVQLEKQLEESKQLLTTTHAESEAKIDVMTEKVNRMKALLVKSKAMNQERELEVSHLLAAGSRPKRFTIQTRLTLPTYDGTTDTETWCLIFEDAPPKARTTSPAAISEHQGQRWATETTVHDWVEDGSIVVGEWPETMQEIWNKALAMTRNQLEDERNRVQGELADLTQNFNAYKQRAQTALKRMGAEEYTERQTKAQETAEIYELRETIKELERQIDGFKSQLETEKELAIRHAQETAADYQHLADAKEKLAAERARTSELEERLQDLQERFDLLKEQYQQTVVLSTTAAAIQIESPINASQSTNVVDEKTVPVSSVTPSPPPPPPAAPVPPPVPVVVVPEPPVTSDVLDSVTTMRAKKLGASSGLLHQQAESEFLTTIAILRKENSTVLSQSREMQHSMALSEDQVQTLKSNIRDLEATLQREREFSAANRVINVEYLVHILRKFLLAANPAERAKLIPILCQILHLRGDDAKAINDKWQVRGIVGWFQQTKANSKNSTNMDDFDGDKSLGTGVANMGPTPTKKKREIIADDVTNHLW